MDSQILSKLPIIDFSVEYLSPGTESWLSTTKQVCYALEEYGCFVIKSNQVSLDLHNSIYSALQDLFDQPPEIKQLISPTPDRPVRGVFSNNANHEGIAMGCLTSSETAQKFTNLIWPAGNNRFCESAHEISKIMMHLDKKVMRMVFQNYGVESLYDSHVASTDYVTGSSRYKKPETDESYLGLSVHTDKTFSTIIHQNDVNGLEIQTKDGQWILYNPSSHSTFLYLAADAFKAWSNNRIRPCCRRVMMSGRKTRFSVGIFTYQKGVIQVPDELLDEEHPLQYKRFSHQEFLQCFQEQRMKNLQYTIEAHCGV